MGINILADTYLLNEKDKYVAGFYDYLRENYHCVNNRLEEIVEKWGLTNNNSEAFYVFRSYVNQIVKKDPTNPELPLLIFTLSCFAFNSMIRYNKDGEFNNTFGKRRYNKNIAKRLYEFGSKLNEQNIIIDNHDFEYVLDDKKFDELDERDFVYLDPPYLITEANYCLGSNWSEDDDKRLYNFLDKLDAKKVKFALSNVLVHKGKTNEVLKDWIDKHNYNVHHLDKNYDKVQLLKGKSNSDEVLITNY